jgi:predicted RND superfamily exporter protein
MILITVSLSLLAFVTLNNYNFETIGIISLLLGVIVGVITSIMIVVAIVIHIPINRKTKLTEYEQTYYVITQMIDNNDKAVITLTSQIAEYNADVLKGRMMQDSKMLSILDYDFYYDLPLIELDNEGGEK